MDKNNENKGENLKWMYSDPSSLINREDYLLGKSIDKNFESLQNPGAKNEYEGRLPQKIALNDAPRVQVDMATKMHEDPLFAIRQREIEARKELLNNPVKLKQIREMIKSQESKARQAGTSDLDILILRMFKKLNPQLKKVSLDEILTKKLEEMLNESDSDSSDSEHEKKKRKRSSSKGKKKRKHRSSSSSSSESHRKHRSSSSSGESHRKHKKHQRRSSSSSDGRQYKKSKTNKREQKRDNFSEFSDHKNELRKKEYKFKEERRKKELYKSKKKHKQSFVSSSPETEERKSEHKRSEITVRHDKKKKMDDSSDDDRNRKRNYGLVRPDGSKPAQKPSHSIPRKVEKKEIEKPKHIRRENKPMTKEDIEKSLKEMEENAKWRSKERENNLKSHREQEKKNEKEQQKEFDEEFLRKQLSYATAQTSVSQRIKANLNNIQRSKSAMDQNFVRK